MIEGQGGGKHKATTTQKTKPDGTREVSHSVEQSIPDMMRHARKRTPEKAPMSHRSSERIHAAVVGHNTDQTRDIASTLAMLKAARQQVSPDAFAGDGTLERPAPMMDSFTPEQMSAAAGTGPLLTPGDPQQQWLLDQMRSRLVPRYKGGRIQQNVGNA